jgi:hypothetical protein
MDAPTEMNRAQSQTGISDSTLASMSGGGLHTLTEKNISIPKNRGFAKFINLINEPILINNTITGNGASYGGGVESRNDTDPVFLNTIIYNNTASTGEQVYLSHNLSDPDFYCCDIERGSAGFGGPGSGVNYWGTFENNINYDPYFVDQANNDFHLSDSSHCLGTAADSVEIISGIWVFCPECDCEEYIRPNPPGSNPDIGAFESPQGFPVAIEQLVIGLPLNYTLSQNYPNPFNPVTLIRFGLPKASDVKIELYNTLGQRVITIYDERKPAGYHVIDFDASEFASGVYFYRIQAADFQKVRKMLVLK